MRWLRRLALPAMIVGALLVGTLSPASTAAEPQLGVPTDAGVPWATEATGQSLAPATPVRIHVEVRPDPAAWQRLVERVHAPEFRPMTSAEVVRAVRPPIGPLLRYLEGFGLRLDEGRSNALTLAFVGEAAGVEQALQVHLGVARSSSGATGRFAVGQPTLPADVAASVASVVGLTDLSHPLPPSRPVTAFPGSPGRCGSRTDTQVVAPADIEAVYGIHRAQPVVVAPLHQGALRIGVLGFSDLIDGDPAAFFRRTGVPQPWPVVHEVQLAPSATQTCDYLIEASVDAEWAGALAPASGITYLEGESSEAGYLDELDHFFNNPELAQVVTASYGWQEANVTPAFAAELSRAITQLAATGVPFVAAAGECRQAPCTGAAPVGIPAASADAVGVGGTSLTSVGGMRLGEESAWPYTFAGTGVSCGCWTNVVGLHAAGSYAAVVDGANLDGMGGTSFGAPIWAGLYSVLADVTGVSLPPGRGPLERIHATDPSAFVEVRTGCSGDRCAVEGPDPLAGFGPPDGAVFFATARRLFGSG